MISHPEAYTYWANALEGRIGAVEEERPQTGFYRIKSAGGIWLPVAIWEEGDAVWVMVGSEEPNASAQTVQETWLRCAKNAVSEKAYRQAVATGQWPGDAPAAERREGDNKAPEGFEAFSSWLKEQIAEAQAWLKGRKIASQDDADKCEKLANDFLKARQRAEAEHKAEKKPHLDAGRAVDAKYKPLIDDAGGMASALKRAVTQFLIDRENEKKAAAAQAIAAGAEAPARIETRATTSGVSGRKVSLRTYKVADIEDWEKAVAFFKDNPELREVVQRLADKCAAVGAPVPGVKVREEQRAA